MRGGEIVVDHPTDDRMRPADTVSSPPSEPSPCPSSFSELVDWFCEEQAVFRARLANMGARDGDTREPPRRDPAAIREPS
jgi:hypothetical protein